MRRALRVWSEYLRDDAGLTSVEHAVVLAFVLAGASATAYALGVGVRETPKRIVAGNSSQVQVVSSPSAPRGNSPTYQPADQIELVIRPPQEPDSPLWPWALFSLVLSVGSIAGYLACRKALELIAQIKVRRKVRDSTTEEEVEEVFRRMEQSGQAGPVVRLRPGDTALVGRNLPDVSLDWLRGSAEPAVASDPVADANRAATVANFMAAFATAPEPVSTASAVREESPHPEPSA